MPVKIPFRPVVSMVERWLSSEECITDLLDVRPGGFKQNHCPILRASRLMHTSALCSGGFGPEVKQSLPDDDFVRRAGGDGTCRDASIIAICSPGFPSGSLLTAAGKLKISVLLRLAGTGKGSHWACCCWNTVPGDRPLYYLGLSVS